MSKRVGYVRVSTVDQNPERQLEGVQLDKKFTDYASGTTLKRPQFIQLLSYVREDDIVMVHSLDRLARNTKDLLRIVEWFLDRNITIVFHKESLTFDGKESAMSKLLLMMLAAIAEFEHALIRERQLEGIRIAKANGKYKGTEKKLKKADIEIMQQQLEQQVTKTRIAKNLGVSRFTLYKYIARLQKNELQVQNA